MADDKIIIGVEGEVDPLVEAVQQSQNEVVKFGRKADDVFKDAIDDVEHLADEFEDVDDNIRKTGRQGKRSFDDIEDAIVDARKDLEKLNDRLENTSKGAGGAKIAMLGAFGGAVGIAIGAGVGAALSGISSAISSIIDKSGELIEAYRIQEAAESQLALALKNTNNVVGFSADQLQEYAGYLQQVTNVGDQATLGIFALQTAFTNVRGDEFLRTTELALDMAVALEQDTVGAAQKLAETLNDPIAGIARLEGEGVRLTETQKKQVEEFVRMNDIASAQGLILDEVAARYGGAAQAAAETGGDFTQLWNRVGDIYEVFGEVIVRILDEFSPAIDVALKVVEMLTGGLRDLTVGLLEGDKFFGISKDTIMSWGAQIIESFTYLQTSVQSSSEQFDILLDSIALFGVKSADIVRHTFTVQIPEFFQWMFDNSTELLTDLDNALITIFKNMTHNVMVFFEGLYDYLAGGEGSFEFKGLVEGFESTLKELPKITEREALEVEKILQERIDRNGGKILERYKENLERNINFVASLTSSNTPERPDFVSQSSPADATGLLELEPEITNAIAAGTANLTDAINAIDSENEGPELGQREGLMALNKRIQDAAFNEEIELAKVSVDLLGDIVDGFNWLTERLEHDLTPANILDNINLENILPGLFGTREDVENGSNVNVEVNNDAVGRSIDRLERQMERLTQQLPFNGVLQ